jgi:hypothetical protein
MILSFSHQLSTLQKQGEMVGRVQDVGHERGIMEGAHGGCDSWALDSQL